MTEVDFDHGACQPSMNVVLGIYPYSFLSYYSSYYIWSKLSSYSLCAFSVSLVMPNVASVLVLLTPCPLGRESDVGGYNFHN